jgi:hypothetical protein
MRALSIAQPYAHLIATGLKRVENRTWMTGYRGLIYIHAGKTHDWLCLDSSGVDERYKLDVKGMAFGAVIATARLIDCVHIDRVGQGIVEDKYPWLAEHEHTEGPWCWIIGGVNPIGPWPWRGQQGLFDIDEEELGAVANKVLGIE